MLSKVKILLYSDLPALEEIVLTSVERCCKLDKVTSLLVRVNGCLTDDANGGLLVVVIGL